jgi:hypothetical protein
MKDVVEVWYKSFLKYLVESRPGSFYFERLLIIISSFSLMDIDLLRLSISQTLVAHACNPSYSGGRDQEDLSSKPAQANSSARPYLEKNLHRKGLVE